MEMKLDTVVPGSKTETTVKSTDVWHDIMPMSVHKYIRGVYNHHFYFPAQLVGGFTLSELLDKPWSQVGVVPYHPRYVPSIFIAHRVQQPTARPFSSNVANSCSRAFR